MKRINIALALLLGGLFLVGCSESYFDKTSTETISTQDLQKEIAKNPALLDGMMKGMYSTLFTKGSGGTDPLEHTDFGQKSRDIATDLLSGDMAQIKSSFGHFYNNEELLSTTRTSATNKMYWKYYYSLIKTCNDILSIFGDDVTKPAVGADRWGQAKAVRGYAYYNLAIMYSKGYDFPKDLCVPIYHIKNTNASAKQSTAKEVFDFAKTDLEAAVDALNNFSRTTKVEVDKNVANGILSYIYLTTGDYDKAIAAADLATAGYNLMSAAEVTGGFATIAIPSLMWGVDITNANTGSLVTFWGHMDAYTYSYAYAGAIKMMDKNIYDQIQPNDVRKYQFSSTKQTPIWKYYDAGRKSGGDRKWENDIFWMRADELFLVKAEAQARSGKGPDAVITLQQLLAKRAATEGTAGAVVGAPSGIPVYDMTNPLEAVYLQWRIETWGEGRGLATLKRFQKTVIRGANHSEKPNIPVSYTDERLTFKIPEVEAINNPYIE